MKELVPQFIDSNYKAKIKTGLVSEKYMINLRGLINRYLDFVMRRGVKCPDGITSDLIRSFLNFLERTGRARATLINYFNSINRFHDYLVTANLATINPTKGLRPKYNSLRKRTILDKRESSDLINKPDAVNSLGLRDRAILGLLYATGMRPSELARLKLWDIDFDQKTVHCCTINKKERVIPLNEDILQVMRDYLKVSRGNINKNFTGEALFIVPLGGTILSQTVFHIIKRYAQEAGIKKPFNSFTLKHTSAAHQKEKMQARRGG